MRLEDINAWPHADGNRIELRWTAPESSAKVCIRRGLRTHPISYNDGTAVENVRMGAATDEGLRGERVYYYTLFTRPDDESPWATHPNNRVSAMAAAGYDFGGQLFAMLPAIYHRYDAALTNPAVVDPRDAHKGVLERFLDLPGAQLDHLYSLVRMALDLHDVERVDGKLLPLLAQWLGWRIDRRMPVLAQRREIRSAPEIYSRLGTFAAVDATARRITGLHFRAKEFVHNIARTNDPEQLNLYSAVRHDPSPSWDAAELVSVNFAFEGRPAHVQVDDSDLFVYHTRRRRGWDIWAKTRSQDGKWCDAEPVVARRDCDTHPAVVVFNGDLHLFWETYNPDEPKPHRRIAYMTRAADGTDWSPIHVAGEGDAKFMGACDAERRRPVVAVDDDDGMWLVWQQRSGDHWDIRYNRHDGAHWQLENPETLEQSESSRIEDDMYVLARPGSDRLLWLFGARRERIDSGVQSRWICTYRVKNGLDPTITTDWDPSQIATASSVAHSREPAPLLGPEGGIELFFSTTRSADPDERSDGSWAIFRTELTDAAANTWTPAEPVATAAGSQRAPLAIRASDATLLTYRSSEPIAHLAAVGAPLDGRYVGTVSYRGKKPVAYGTFDDTQTYTYTTAPHGKDLDIRISREAVGFFLHASESTAASELSPDELNSALTRLQAVTAEFVPINSRVLFVMNQKHVDMPRNGDSKS